MKTLLTMMALLLTCGIQAQVKMRDVIREMPDTLVPYLKQNARLDFIDFKDSGMKAEVTNDFGGKSQLVELTDDYALFKLNAASEIQLRLLDIQDPRNDARQLICMVRTFGSDVRESVLSFYTVNWHELPSTGHVSLPSYMHRLTLSPQAPELIIENERGLERPANEAQTIAEKVLTTLKWDGKMFKNIN